ncbi:MULTISPECIES: diaminobutyrate--2-oxoglutarate transaminase [Henriciella]|jgi:diaminobutyrate-2-oxoglutarate transaminase|uniref:diaminobutyrate--2-oxoglutarate transaminase n=1 Tax=Henriciella TaxID=453849 RepID=UPI003514AEC5
MAFTDITDIQDNIFERRESKVRSYCRNFDTLFVKASGSEMTDASGKTYIDFLAGCSTLNYGHNDPDMKAALIEHITRDGVAHGLDMYTDAKAAWLAAFEKHILTPRGMKDYKIMMTGPTGTNAVEAAVKLARKVTGRSNVVAFTNGFHGMTLGALALTGNAGKRAGAGLGGSGLHGTTHLPYAGAFGDDVDTLDQIEMMLENSSSGLDAPAAFIFEPIQGEGGLNAASKEWMQGIARLAKKHGALLIVDDIQAGCGRSGDYFGFEIAGIQPDIITQAKSLSGMGLPFACVLLKKEHDIWKPAEHNGTFRGNNHAFVTARVALEKFWSDDSFQKEVREKSEILTEGLKKIANLIPGAKLKGRGMMQGVDVGTGDLASDICSRAFEKGLIIETSGANDEVVKVLAPLTTPVDTFRKGLSILLEAAEEATSSAKIAAE